MLTTGGSDLQAPLGSWTEKAGASEGREDIIPDAARVLIVMEALNGTQDPLLIQIPGPIRTDQVSFQHPRMFHRPGRQDHVQARFVSSAERSVEPFPDEGKLWKNSRGSGTEMRLR